MKTLLYVEDDNVLRDLILRKFQTQDGLQILLAENGQVGIEMMDRDQPDLLITGVNMPVLDGFSILEHIKRKGYTFPKIILTNFDDKENRDHAKEFGVDEYLIKKETTINVLWKTIARYLGFKLVVPWNNDPATLHDGIHGGTWNGCEIYLWKGDITSLTVDAIVNAANTALQGGAGVDGAIHHVGGPTILEECQRLMKGRTELDIGEAAPTGAGKLRAKHVIHVLGPRFYKEEEREPLLLASAYQNALSAARKLGVASIAFPCISTGYFVYPSKQACDIAVDAVRDDLIKKRWSEATRFLYV